jgi:hypothetical protein
MRTVRPPDPRTRTVSAPLARRWAVAVAITCALGTAPGAGPVENGRPGRLVLFDGKSLDGWKKTGFTGAGAVKVEGGAILLNAGRPMTGITSTRRDLPTTNYELSYEAMRLTGRDFFAAGTFPVGKSFLTLVNGGWGGSVTGLSSLDGADASENETGRFFPYRDKTWYRFRVRVTGAMIRCWIDDHEVIALDHQGRQLGTRIETRANQPLGFATWETGGALRTIEVRMLTPAEVAAVNKSGK